MDLCYQCGMGMGLADGPMLAFWQGKTAANPRESLSRADQPGEKVCPVCDCYLLGVEMELGLPFYSPEIAAFVTVNDWDWWNSDPADCDIRQWPDFGCLTFSMESLESTVLYLRERESPLLDSNENLRFSPELIGPTGIPEDSGAAAEWQRQLDILHSQLEDRYSKRELDIAVRRLVALLAKPALRQLHLIA